MNKNIIWALTLIVLVIIICGTIIYLNENPYSIRFEMDNNTLEAVKSINYSALSETRCQDVIIRDYRDTLQKYITGGK